MIFSNAAAKAIARGPVRVSAKRRYTKNIRQPKIGTCPLRQRGGDRLIFAAKWAASTGPLRAHHENWDGTASVVKWPPWATYSNSCTSESTPRGMQTVSTVNLPTALCLTPRGT